MKENTVKISIIGTGTWGIGLANMLCSKGLEVWAWSALPEEIDYIQKYRKHPRLKDTHILDEIILTKDLSTAIKGKDVIVMAVPSSYVRTTSQQIASYIQPSQIIVDVAKGIEAHTLMTMSEIIHEEINHVLPFDYGQIVALSGPTHAEEVAIGLPSTIVSASLNQQNAKTVQDIFTTPFMRVYTNEDIKGVEICGSLKNVIALGAGISHGLGYGDNATAALVTRGIHEMARLGIAMGCPMHTFYGLAGLGDLIVTCTSLHSRNNQCGMYIGQGLDVESAIKKVGMVVEGIHALDAAYSLKQKYNVELPIIEGVYHIVKEQGNPSEVVKQLFNRVSKSEIPFSTLQTLHQNGKSKKILVVDTFDYCDYHDMDWLEQVHLQGDIIIVALPMDGQEDYSLRKKRIDMLRYVDYVIPLKDLQQINDACLQYHIDMIVMKEKNRDQTIESVIPVTYL